MRYSLQIFQVYVRSNVEFSTYIVHARTKLVLHFIISSRYSQLKSHDGQNVNKTNYFVKLKFFFILFDFNLSVILFCSTFFVEHYSHKTRVGFKVAVSNFLFI